MSGVGLGVLENHLVAVKTVEFLGLLHEEGVAEYFLGRIVVLLVVQSVHTAEVRDSGFSADTGAAEEYDIVTFFICNDYTCFADSFWAIGDGCCLYAIIGCNNYARGA